MSEQQAVDPDIVEMPVEDPDKEKTCQLQLPHPYTMTTGTWHTCGRKAAYWVETNNKPCGHKGQMYLCESCWAHVTKSPPPEIRHVPKCGKSYHLMQAATAWRRL